MPNFGRSKFWDVPLWKNLFHRKNGVKILTFVWRNLQRISQKFFIDFENKPQKNVFILKNMSLTCEINFISFLQDKNF